MRAVDARYDERQGGFRGMLDLLHQAQREGLLRLHRDRKGTWRAFPAAPATAVETKDQIPSEPGMISPAPPAVDEASLSEIAADGMLESEIPVEPEVSLEEVMQEPLEEEPLEEEPRTEEETLTPAPWEEAPAPRVTEEPTQKPKRARGKSAAKPGARRRTPVRRKTKEEPPKGTPE